MDSDGFTGDGAAPTAMANMIAALPSLKRFRVGGNSEIRPTLADKPAFASFIAAVAADASRSKLESFSFTCPGVSEDKRKEYESFGKAVASMPELREINMTGCWWSESDRDAFLPHFITKKPPTLSKLVLKDAGLSDHDLQTVSKIIEKQPLEVIDISNNDASDQGLHHISEALGNLQNLTPSVPCHLREVYALELKKVTDRGIQELFQSLQNCPNLTLVDVSTPSLSLASAITGLSKDTIEMAMKARRSSWPNIKRLVVTYMKREYNLVEVDPL